MRPGLRACNHDRPEAVLQAAEHNGFLPAPPRPWAARCPLAPFEIALADSPPWALNRSRLSDYRHPCKPKWTRCSARMRQAVAAGQMAVALGPAQEELEAPEDATQAACRPYWRQQRRVRPDKHLNRRECLRESEGGLLLEDWRHVVRQLQQQGLQETAASHPVLRFLPAV